ncbi:unnamed protein product [Cuscuta campestris]|uniref:DNA topoisomerase (ATP-hydrolyzing) n=1 Tax=Cuscuta campestris TaxID=132261 RepID=A0A484NEB3_9ASTE|nr:unnamed protein product [Cuscuta campestris]
MFKLTSLIKTNEMFLFDEMGSLRQYQTPEEILIAHFRLRLEYYRRRREKKLDNLQKEVALLNAKVRFIDDVSKKEIRIKNISEDNLFRELKRKDYYRDESTSLGYDYVLSVLDYVKPDL